MLLRNMRNTGHNHESIGRPALLQ